MASTTPTDADAYVLRGPKSLDDLNAFLNWGAVSSLAYVKPGVVP